MLLAPDSQSLETALLVLDQVARKWAMSVNYDKTIGVVVTPPTAATQGDQPASAVTTAAPPGSRCVPTGWRSRATSVPGQHQGNGGFMSGRGELENCSGPAIS